MATETTDQASEDTTRTLADLRKQALLALYKSMAEKAEEGDALSAHAFATAISAVLDV